MDIKARCLQCGKEFTITECEIDFYNRKNLHLPKRCKECREKNKKGQSNKENHTMKNDFKEDFEYRKPQSKAKKKNSHKDLLIGILIIIVAILTAYVINSEKLSIVSDDSSSEYSTTILSDDESKYNDLQDDTEITSRSSQAETQTEQAEQTERTDSDYIEYHFRYTDRLDEHYIKHGIEMGFTSAEEYEKRASDIINSPDALTKNEKEDNDFCYFIESTGEFVVLSTDGYIRTYYITDKSYFDRQ